MSRSDSQDRRLDATLPVGTRRASVRLVQIFDSMRRVLVGICLMGAASSCSGGALNPVGTGGAGGAGTGGTVGTGGAGTGGTPGTGGTAGASGTGGTAGMAGTGGSGGMAGTGGTAGTSGTGGTAGTTGMGGTAGMAGTGGTAGIGGSPVCIPAGQGDVVEFLIVGSDAMPVAAPATATVSVTSIDSCAQVTCPTVSTVSSGSISAAASRFTLTAPGPQEWTVYLRDSAMPSDLIKVGDTFDLTINAGHDSTFYQQNLDQMMVLSRDGNLVFFAAGLDRSFQLATPNLDAFGIQISDAGAVSCQTGSFGACLLRPHGAHVAVGGDDTIVTERQTSTIGWLSITNASFTEWDDTGGCDALSATIMAGFRSP